MAVSLGIKTERWIYIIIQYSIIMYTEHRVGDKWRLLIHPVLTCIQYTVLIASICWIYIIYRYMYTVAKLIFYQQILNQVNKLKYIALLDKLLINSCSDWLNWPVTNNNNLWLDVPSQSVTKIKPSLQQIKHMYFLERGLPGVSSIRTTKASRQISKQKKFLCSIYSCGLVK